MGWFRKLMTLLFDRQYVLLVHYDGQKQARQAIYENRSWGATPYLAHTRCKLLPSGNIKGESYVHEWLPLTKPMWAVYNRQNRRKRCF